MKSQLKLILWDLDGTLIDSESIHEKASLDALKEIGFTSEVPIPAGLEGSAVFELLTNLEIKKHNELFKKWQSRSIELALANITDKYAIHQSVELVKYFAKRGLAQSVVSNSPLKMLEHSIRQINLAPFFSNFFSRDSVEFGKPNPQLYLNALKHHQLPPENCLCFEDSGTGIKATQSANLNCIGIGLASKTYNPNLVCDLKNNNWLDDVLRFINLNYSE